jgi:hypothetical protein
MSDTIKNKWLINLLLAVILVLLIGNYARNHAMKTADAAGGGWETDGLMVLTTNGAAERVVLVDTKKQNIMIYHPRNAGGFGLSGMRSYKYDIEIEDTEGKIKGNGWTYFDAKAEYDKAKSASK